MLAHRLGTYTEEKLPPPTIPEIELVAQQIMKTSIKLNNSSWMSQFHLHHRGVQTYYHGRTFLARDAAHIHSPAVGQEMNTGIQDATNLSWKLGLVLKKRGSKKILNTYETERHRMGKILLSTSDRFFSVMTTKNFLISLLRNLLLPLFIKFLFSKKVLKNVYFGLCRN